jgi:acetolactate synthase I/II/III large subunit
VASPAQTLAAITDSAGNRQPGVDGDWISGLRTRHQERAAKLRQSMATAEAEDGRVHPNRMLAALQESLTPTRLWLSTAVIS